VNGQLNGSGEGRLRAGEGRLRAGEARLRAALQRRREARAAQHGQRETLPPLDLRPTTPFEQLILAEFQALRRDYEELKKRVDWLTLAILGAALTLVLERVIGG
jgi:hypothetical protein